jgi:hypothetical protein
MVLMHEISARYNLIQHDSQLNQFLNFRALNMVSVFQDQLVFFRFSKDMDVKPDRTFEFGWHCPLQLWIT